MQFGRVIDATLMMDKDTGRPRGFGFVTFDGDDAVDRALSRPLEIYGKPMEVKRAQPRSTLQAEEKSKFGRNQQNDRFGGRGGGDATGGNNFDQQGQMAGAGGMAGQAGMTPAMMAKYWFNMQQYFKQMQQNMMGGAQIGMPNAMAGGQMNPQAMMMAQMMGMGGPGAGVQGMDPAMMQQMQMQQMQQMQQQQQQQGGNQGNFSPQSQVSGNQQDQGGYEQQQKSDHPSQPRAQQPQQQYVQQGNFNQGGPQAWEGMYDDVPQPTMGNQGGNRGQGFQRGGYRGGRSQNTPPVQPSNAPINAPTGPKNSGGPAGGFRGGYRGGGRGSNRGFHPYSRGQ
jgi:RNA-binding protein Musashi